MASLSIVGQDEGMPHTPAAGFSAASVAHQALTAPESLPTFPAVIVGIDRIASKVPWWIMLAGGIALGWFAAGYMAKRKSSVKE